MLLRRACLAVSLIVFSVLAATFSLGHFSGSNSDPKTVVLFFDDGWKNHYSIAFPILREYSFHATFSIVTGLMGADRGTSWARMNREEIKKLSEKGMEIASHSVTHPFLQSLSDEELTRELEDSKKNLQKIVEKKKIITFIIPYDESNETINQKILTVFSYFRPPGATIWIYRQSLEEFASLVDSPVTFLCYHSIKECADSDYTTPPDLFLKHMRYLHENNYKVISFYEYMKNANTPNNGKK